MNYTCGEGTESSLASVKSKFKSTECAIVLFNSCHMWKPRGCCFCHVVPERWQKSGLIWLSVASDPLNRISRVLLTATFLLLGYKPRHGTCPIHHRLLAPVMELKLWHSSLGNVLQLLHCSIFVCLCTLGIVLDLFWCSVMTAFQCLLTSLRYKI